MSVSARDREREREARLRRFDQRTPLQPAPSSPPAPRAPLGADARGGGEAGAPDELAPLGKVPSAEGEQEAAWVGVSVLAERSAAALEPRGAIDVMLQAATSNVAEVLGTLWARACPCATEVRSRDPPRVRGAAVPYGIAATILRCISYDTTLLGDDAFWGDDMVIAASELRFRQLWALRGPRGEERSALGADEARAGVCRVCYSDTQPPHVYTAASCGHAFCDTCWANVTAEAAGDAARGAAGPDVKCPERGCVGLLHDGLVDALAPPELVPQLHRLRLEDYARKTGLLYACPVPGCARAALVPDPLTVEVTEPPTDLACGAAHAFCARCRALGGHAPATCDQARAWATACAAEEARLAVARRAALAAERAAALAEAALRHGHQWHRFDGDAMRHVDVWGGVAREGFADEQGGGGLACAAARRALCGCRR